MENDPKKTGPKPMPPDRRRSAIVRVRLTPAEVAAVDAAAEREGVTRSEWVRRVIRVMAQIGESQK